MSRANRRTLGYSAWSLAPVAVVTALLGLRFSVPGVVIALLLSLPWFAWRYDNESGAFLVLAVLLLLVIAIPALLLLLMAVTH